MVDFSSREVRPFLLSLAVCLQSLLLLLPFPLVLSSKGTLTEGNFPVRLEEALPFPMKRAIRGLGTVVSRNDCNQVE